MLTDYLPTTGHLLTDMSKTIESEKTTSDHDPKNFGFIWGNNLFTCTKALLCFTVSE